MIRGGAGTHKKGCHVSGGEGQRKGTEPPTTSPHPAGVILRLPQKI